MRIGLIAALRRSAPGGAPRAVLPVAGRSLLARQAALLASLGAERVLCLADAPQGEVLALQHALEAGGVQFHALTGFAALPALVRAEDELIVILDGLLPDPEVVRALLGGGSGTPMRAVATLPADHPLAAAHPEDFERIDAARRWAGVLAMRGAPVQQLADFPADADAVALLLRLALQAGTPLRDLAARDLPPEGWVLVSDAAAAAQHERALIARAAPPADRRAPGDALAAAVARALVPQGAGRGSMVAGVAALAGLLAGVLASASGFAATGLLLASLGAFAGEVAAGLAGIAARLERDAATSPAAPSRSAGLLAGASDLLAGAALWFALAPLPAWQPLAVLGPVVIALARIVARGGSGSALAAAARPGGAVAPARARRRDRTFTRSSGLSRLGAGRCFAAAPCAGLI